MNSFQEGHVKVIDIPLDYQIGIETVSRGRPSSRLIFWFNYLGLPSVVGVAKKTFLRFWHLSGYALLLFGTIGMLSHMVSRNPSISAIVFINAIALVMIVARVGLFSVIDASSWNGMQVRYILPIIPLYTLWGILGFWILLENFNRNRV